MYMFNFIDIYSFIPVSGCVGIGPSALLCPGAYNVIKTTRGYPECLHQNRLTPAI